MKTIIVALFLCVSLVMAEKAPNFTLKSINGRNYTLSKNLDGIKVINFWATWCVPCISEMEAYKILHSEFDSLGVEFVSISIDDTKSQGKVASFVKSRAYPFTVLLDPSKNVAKKYQVRNPPLVVVVNAQQEVIYRHFGYAKGDEAKMREVILNALKTE